MSNAIDIRRLIKDNPAIAYSAAVAVVVLAVYLVIFAPLLKKLGVKYAECRACESQLWDARSTIKYAENLDKSAGARMLISEKEASAGIEELTRFGKSLGISFSEIKPGEITYTAGAAYKTMPIEISMKATGDQFVKFMGSVDELKKAIVRMKSFNITPEKEDRKELDIKMVAEIYLSPDA
jgi:Tfp pilus assembly protein PilO